MKRIIILALFVMGSQSTQAQVGINTTNPNSILDIEASNSTSPTNLDGILIPRIDVFPSVNPTGNQDGMMVFLNVDITGYSRGFYYWDNNNTDWIFLSTGGNNTLDEAYDQGGAGLGRSITADSGPVLINSSERGLVINSNITNDYEEALRITTDITGNNSYGLNIRMEGNSSITLPSTSSVSALHNHINFDMVDGIVNGLENVFLLGTHSGSLSNTGYRGVFNNFYSITNPNGFNIGITNEFSFEAYRFVGLENIFRNDAQQIYGVWNRTELSPEGLFKGVFNELIHSSTSGEDTYGVHSILGGSSTGDKYGTYVDIAIGSGGTHYGLYSNVLKTGSFSGYFLGNVYIGSNSSNGYILPASDGTVNQIMTTNGSGQLNFVDPSAVFSDTDTDDQSIDTFSFNSSTNILTLEIEDDGIAAQTVDLSTLDRSDWSLTGNGGTDPSVNFLGTIDNQELSFRVNNNQRMRLTAKGQLEMTNGSNSLFIGEEAGENDNLTDNRNTFIGYQNGFSSNTSQYNTSIGYQAMYNSNGANNNMAIGNRSLYFNSTGSFNTGVGFRSLYGNTTGVHNIGIGINALYTSQNNDNSIAIGSYVLTENNNGSDNIAIGFRAGDSDTTSSQNIYIGTESGGGNGTSENKSGNVFIGYYSGYNATGNNKLYIENSDSNTPLIYGEFDNNILRANGELQVNNPATTGYAFPSVDGANGQVMTTDGNGVLSWSNAVESTTANNGLTEIGNDIRLGGTLIQNTTIAQANQALNFNLNGTGDFIIQDNGTGKFTVLDNGDTVLGGDLYWRDEDTGGTILAQMIDDGNDARFILRENGNTSVDLDTNNGFIFNEQGLDRDFRIESNTWQNIFRVDAGNNRVGIGTATPDYRFSVNGTANLMEDQGTGTALRVQGDEALWYDGTRFSWGFGGTSNTFADDVGIGMTAIPAYRLDVRENVTNSFVAQIQNNSGNADADGLRIVLSNVTPGNNNIYLAFRGSTLLRGSVRGTGTGVSYNTTSDRRLKTNIIDVNNSLELIEEIQPRIYEYKEVLGAKEYGFIAQELQPFYPQAVTGSPDSNVETDPMMVDYGRLTPLLTAGIKELKEEVDTLKTENAKLKAKLEKLESLEARLTALENKTERSFSNKLVSKE